MRKEGVSSIISPVLAFLASQHHNLHMMMMAAGTGSAWMGFMNVYPAVRRVMLVISLVMAGITVYRVRAKDRPSVMRIVGVGSALLTLGLVGWSVWQFGL